MGFSRQQYWNGLLFPTSGDFPRPEMEPASLKSPALVGRYFTTSTSWEAHSGSSICLKKTHTKAITVKFKKTRNKEKILKSSREFFLKRLRVKNTKSEWHQTFQKQCWKLAGRKARAFTFQTENNFESRNVCQDKLSIECERL